MGFEDAGDCRLGVSFALPAHHVTFGLFVSEVDGKVFVQLGPSKPVQIDVNDSGQRNKFYDDLVGMAKSDILKPKKAGAEPIGFSVSPSQVTPDEPQ